MAESINKKEFKKSRTVMTAWWKHLANGIQLETRFFPLFFYIWNEENG